MKAFYSVCLYIYIQTDLRMKEFLWSIMLIMRSTQVISMYDCKFMSGSLDNWWILFMTERYYWNLDLKVVLLPLMPESHKSDISSVPDANNFLIYTTCLHASTGIEHIMFSSQFIMLTLGDVKHDMNDSRNLFSRGQ